MKQAHHAFRLACLAAACALMSLPAHAQSADLAAKVDQLSSELAAVKAQLASQSAAQSALQNASVANGATVEAATVLTSYGEMGARFYNKDTARNSADLTRFVLGFQHRFDPKTKLVAEVEVEHAVTSADDAGEVAIEQAYVERQLSDRWAARAGLFVMPMGLLNENHEPTAYYGVERNFVETAIIPSTWREGGVQFVGELDRGVTVQAGVSTGFNLTKWDSTDAETAESPLGAVHQEMSQARSRDWGFFGAVNWRGVPGLQLGTALFTGQGDHGDAGVPKMGVTLWDLHARYTPGAWDLSALYAQGTISRTADFNQTLVGNDYLVPSRFSGWYTQAAYKLWSNGDLTLSPFVRWEEFNTREAYADLGAGLTPAAAKAERVITVGANLAVGSGVVVKADVQRFKQNSNDNRLNLGLGWSF
ncbi:hypothetical protein [Aquabacterium sp.]|uniref:hypothetical protein n=1 Tax=Aquabacterium sp. TaxID=1872578 RepID=UPI002E2EC2C1|nr:hypothetical protein [Aquabacterium sp.]HEX5310628.1 hypothetical protein [Aquabacterium sp.]